MNKCLCNDAHKNSQCIPYSFRQLKSFRENQNFSTNLKLKQVNVNRIDKKTTVSNTYGFCLTNTLCLVRSVFKNDTLGIEYSCEQNTTRTTRSTNKCDDKTNIYYRVNVRGEEIRSARLPQYCCSSGDFCNSKLGSNLDNFNPFKLFTNKNEIQGINGGDDKNIHLYLSTSIVTILLVWILAMFSISYMVVKKKRQRSVPLRDAESEKLKNQNEKLTVNDFNKVIKSNLCLMNN